MHQSSPWLLVPISYLCMNATVVATIFAIQLLTGERPATALVVTLIPNLLCGLWVDRAMSRLGRFPRVLLLILWSYVPMVPGYSLYYHLAEGGHATFIQAITALPTLVTGTVLLAAGALGMTLRRLPERIRRAVPWVLVTIPAVESALSQIAPELHPTLIAICAAAGVGIASAYVSRNSQGTRVLRLSLATLFLLLFSVVFSIGALMCADGGWAHVIAVEITGMPALVFCIWLTYAYPEINRPLALLGAVVAAGLFALGFVAWGATQEYVFDYTTPMLWNIPPPESSGYGIPAPVFTAGQIGRSMLMHAAMLAGGAGIGIVLAPLREENRRWLWILGVLLLVVGPAIDLAFSTISGLLAGS